LDHNQVSAGLSLPRCRRVISVAFPTPTGAGDQGCRRWSGCVDSGEGSPWPRRGRQNLKLLADALVCELLARVTVTLAVAPLHVSFGIDAGRSKKALMFPEAVNSGPIIAR